MAAWTGQAGSNGWFDYRETDPGQPDNEYISNWGVSSSAPIFPTDGSDITIGNGFTATGGYGSFNNLSVSGSLSTAYGQGFTLSGVLANTGNLTISPSFFSVGPGTETNSGTINVVGGGGGTGFNTTLAIVGSDTFQGGGTIVLSSDYWAGQITNANGQNATFLNADNTISGAGIISSSNAGGVLTFINDGTVNADQASGQLDLYANTTNNGRILATGAAGLSVFGVTIDNTNGTFEAEAGSTINLVSAVIKGGISSAAGGQISLFSSADADTSSTFDGSASTFSLSGTVNSYVGLHLKGALSNAGTINLLGGFLSLDSSAVTLSGHGTITSSGVALRSVAGQSTTLTNKDNTISGYGQIASNRNGGETLTFVNKGTVNATDGSNQFALGDGDSRAMPLVIRNFGLIEATGAAGLSIVRSTLDNTAGTVVAKNGSHIDLNSVVLKGSITSQGTGDYRVLGNAADTSVYLDGRSSAFTSRATIDVLLGALHVEGALANEGTISLNSSTLELDTASFALSGAGQVVLTGGYIRSKSGQDTTLTNNDNTISGYGAVAATNSGGETMTFVNKGTVDANDATNQLFLGNGANTALAIQNYGLIEATGAAGLAITDATFDNISGTLRADNGSHVDLSGAVLTGSITSRGTGYFSVSGNGGNDTQVFLDGRAAAFTSAATIDVSSGVIHVEGTLANSGTIDINSSYLELDTPSVVLSGRGQVVLSNGSILAKSGESITLTNNGNKISGYGRIATNNGGATLNFINRATVNANSSGNQLTLGDDANTTVRNYGLLEATAGGALQIDGKLQNIGIIRGVVSTSNGQTTVTADTAGQLHLTGGTGDNRFVVRSAPTRIDGGAGSDTIEVAATVKFAAGSVANVETIQVDNGVTAGLSSLTTGETIRMASTAGGRATVYGTQGNDVIHDGAGTDTMLGGKGNDTYYVTKASDIVKEATDGGTDRVLTSVSYALGAGQSIEALRAASATATTAIDLSGNDLGNIIAANAGHNTITGGGGNDTLSGLGGPDTFVYHAAWGLDQITDFTAGNAATHDTIQIDKSLFADYTALKAHATQSGSSTIISYDAADKITLQNTAVGHLTSADFKFV